MANKKKYVGEYLKKIEELISIGYPQNKICEAIGIRESALSNAKKRNKELSNAITRARIKFIEHHLRNIEEFSKKDWRASKYQLEIHDPEHFSEKKLLALTGEGGEPVKVIIVKSYSGKVL